MIPDSSWFGLLVHLISFQRPAIGPLSEKSHTLGIVELISTSMVSASCAMCAMLLSKAAWVEAVIIDSLSVLKESALAPPDPTPLSSLQITDLAYLDIPIYLLHLITTEHFDATKCGIMILGYDNSISEVMKLRTYQVKVLRSMPHT